MAGVDLDEGEPVCASKEGFLACMHHTPEV
jgi:hypothetical protein